MAARKGTELPWNDIQQANRKPRPSAGSWPSGWPRVLWWPSPATWGRDADDLFDIGWEDFLRRGGVCAVEWSETIQEALEPDTIYVDIRRGAETNQRILTIRGPGW